MTQTVQMPPLPPDIFGPSPMEIAVAVIMVLGAVGVLGIAWTLVRGLLRKWSSPAPDHEAIHELRRSVQQLSADVTELQERLDFAERVLATRKDAERLARGGT